MEKIINDCVSENETVRIAVEPDYYPNSVKVGSITYIGANPRIVIYPKGLNPVIEVPIFI